MKRIWARVGVEINLTEEEFAEISRANKEDSTELERLLIKALKEKAELSGETYIVGKDNGGVDDYDNPNEEISVLF